MTVSNQLHCERETQSHTTEPARPHLKSSWLGDGFVLATVLVFLMFEVLQGPLRYYLSKMGGVALAYAPKGLMLCAFFGLAVRTLWTLHLNRLVMMAAFVLLVFILIGAYFTHGISQPLLGFFSLAPLFFGIASEPVIFRHSAKMLPCAVALWLCVAVGVSLNYIHPMPWTGFTYQLGDTEVEASRDWTYFGMERIAGFARASFEAATQLLFLGMTCAVLLRRRSVALLVWIATGVLIALTTTKTTLGLYALITVLLPLVVITSFPHLIRKSFASALPWSLSVIGIMLPASIFFTSQGSVLANESSGAFLVSFGMRFKEVWPNTFALIFNNGNALLGRGVGGIGAAQKVFEPTIYSPADNVYLYLYATFGMFALVIIVAFTSAVSRLRLADGRLSQLFWLLGISIMMEGWTVSCIEGGTMALVAGLTAAYSLRMSRMRSRHQSDAALWRVATTKKHEKA